MSELIKEYNNIKNKDIKEKNRDYWTEAKIIIN